MLTITPWLLDDQRCKFINPEYRMISFLQCIIFEPISYTEFIFIKVALECVSFKTIALQFYPFKPVQLKIEYFTGSNKQPF